MFRIPESQVFNDSPKDQRATSLDYQNLKQLPKSKQIAYADPSVNCKSNLSSTLSNNGVFSASQRKLLDMYSNQTFIRNSKKDLLK